jgi:hypothetical protein
MAEKKVGGVTGKGFTKGDPRINRKGRPKTFDALRSLAQEIAHETIKENGQPILIDGREITVAEAILRQWASSIEPRLQVKFVEVAFGKVPDEILLGGKKNADAIPVNFVDYRTGLRNGTAEAEE